MVKKVIQVPINDDLLIALDHLSEKQSTPRAELIRKACRQYLKQVEQEELDQLYRKGYKNTPEAPEVAAAQLSLASRVISAEQW
jgi:metal-responsive CopG/Arc/MetJ family transcriptional regulator